MLMLFDKSFYLGKYPRGHFIRIAIQRATSYKSLRSQFKRKKDDSKHELVLRIFNYALFVNIDGDNHGF